MPDSTLSTLTQIRTKIRRLTRNPSTAQITDAQLDDYINTFVLYDFPEHLRLFTLRTTHTFYTQPFQDVYPADEDSFGGVTTNPLYNFRNRFISVHEPIYVSGRRALLSQSRDQFFNIYPFINNDLDTGLAGNGVTLTFTGTLTPPGGIVGGSSLLQYHVVFTSVDANGSGLAMVDRPLVSTTYGNNLEDGNLYEAGQEPAILPTVSDATNTINYDTGVFTVTFATPPANAEAIRAKIRVTSPAIPEAVLYFNNKFIVRPVPDDVYPVQFEAYIRPSELLATDQQPELSQWWQYIALGAARKIFEDKFDFESVAKMMPLFKEQERLALRRTLVQQSNERVATIYTEYSNYGYGFWNNENNI